MVADGYELRPVEVSDAGLAACGALLRRVFPHTSQFTDAYLAWQYVQNPAGPVVGFNAYAGDALAAHYVTLPLAARVGGATVRGLLSLNTATHPDHQGKGLFTALAEATYGAGADGGYAFVIGVANANSTPGFVRKLGFDLVAPLDARIGVGPVGLAEDPSAVGFERHWDQASLAWRVANPSAQYRLRTTGRRVTVSAATDRPGVAALLGTFDAGLRPAGVADGSIGTRPLTLWIGLDPDVAAKRSAYVRVPERFRPSPLNLIHRSLGSGGPSVRADDVRIRALDFDPY